MLEPKMFEMTELRDRTIPRRRDRQEQDRDELSQEQIRQALQATSATQAVREVDSEL